MEAFARGGGVGLGEPQVNTAPKYSRAGVDKAALADNEQLVKAQELIIQN